MEDQAEIAGLLREISVQQRTQLERQAEAIAIQREQFDMARRQFERAERLQERAEQLQARGAGMIAMTRKTMMVVLPVIVVLVLYLSWLLFGR